MMYKIILSSAMLCGATCTTPSPPVDITTLEPLTREQKISFVYSFIEKENSCFKYDDEVNKPEWFDDYLDDVTASCISIYNAYYSNGHMSSYGRQVYTSFMEKYDDDYIMCREIKKKCLISPMEDIPSEYVDAFLI